MSFSIDSLRNKLEALDESQDSIVSTSQWVLFYYRHSVKIVDAWKSYLAKANQKKKLPLIYLANDVVQNARAKKRTEFIDAFAEVLPIALTNAYNSVPEPTKQKILKIVRVWKERQIFPKPIEIDGVSDSTPVGSSSSSSSRSKRQAPEESFDTLPTAEKLKVLGTTATKFNTLFHQTLLAARGNYSAQQLSDLNTLVDVIDETVVQLNDLKQNIQSETKSASERTEALKQKKLELERKQQEIAEQKRLQEQKILEALRKKKEEDEILPTYEDNDSSDDSDEEEEKQAPKEKLAEEKEEEKEEKEESEEPASKKLRFAD